MTQPSRCACACCDRTTWSLQQWWLDSLALGLSPTISVFEFDAMAHGALMPASGDRLVTAHAAFERRTRLDDPSS